MTKTGFITAVHRDRYEMIVEEENIFGRLKSSDFYHTDEVVDFPTVGDYVEVDYNASGDSRIISVLPRKSVFARLNPTQGLPDQAVAANFDYVFITMSLNQDFHITKLERYLTVAWQSGGTPIILLTKSDLCAEKEQYLIQVSQTATGVETLCISSKTGEGMERLEPYLARGKVSVLLGSSGVGKSSMVNSLTGAQQMLTGDIREADAQGRHTTTYKQCIFLPEEIQLPNGMTIAGGGCIIDTPGMRKLIVSDVEEGMQNSYADIENLAMQCRFRDCTHKTEPGCAVRKALEDGVLSQRRWKTYLDLQREERFSREREQIMLRKKARTRRKKGDKYAISD